MEAKPLVSVVMPVYNGEKYLRQSIESILNQTYENIELIIIEDSSTDSSKYIVEEYKNTDHVIIVNNPSNMGISYSTNCGIGWANGKYIALMDDDDISLPNRIKKQVSFLENNKEIDIVGGGSIKINSAGEVIGLMTEVRQNYKYNKALLLFESVSFCNGTAMIRSEFLHKTGLRYQDNCLGMQDYNFYIDAVNYGKISGIIDIVYKYRWHESNETKKQCQNQMRYELQKKFIKKSFEKQSLLLDEKNMEAIASIVPDQGNNFSEENFKLYQTAIKNLLTEAKLKHIDYYNELKFVCINQLSQAYKKMISYLCGKENNL